MIIGPWRNQVSPMLPPKLGHILRCLAFSEFFLMNKDVPLTKSHFESTMENSFFTFLITDQKAIFFNSNYLTLYEKNAFRNDFKHWEVPKLENMHFHLQAYWRFVGKFSTNCVRKG